MVDSYGQSINDSGYWKIKHNYFKNEKGGRGGFNAYSITIGSTSGYTPYKTGGVISQYKKPFNLHHRPLTQALFDTGI